MPASKSIDRILRQCEPWIEWTRAGQLLARHRRTLEGWIRLGIIRAMRVEPDVFVSRDDLLYVVRTNRQYQGHKQKLMTLVERGIVPLDCENMTGFEIIEWTSDVQ